jgi:hypothetical protein
VAWFVLPTPLEVEEGHALTFTLQFNNGESAYNLGRVRLSASSEVWVDTPQLDELVELAMIPPAERSKPQQQRLDEAFLRSDATLGPLHAELQSVTQARDKLSSQIPTAMVLRELPKPRPTHIHVRGDFLRLGDELKPDVPSVLPQLPTESEDVAAAANATPASRTRLDLAQWLVRADQPLTPRVQVNRIWMRLFGIGIVDTENDFGAQSSLPTHPELLDWLASEYIEQDWSLKRLLRTIVTSNTYRQASHVRGAGVKVDPTNRLLWRQNRLRVEGEIVRDLALAASGLLSNKLGGPSVFPPQPDGVYAFTQVARRWPTSQGEDRYRRGMYTAFYRSAPHPMLTTFDAPNFNQTCTRRDRSNTPLQSLTVANDEAMFETAQALAARALREAGGPAAKEQTPAVIERLFQLCLSRSPSAAEQQALAAFAKEQQEHFAQDHAKAAAIAPGGLFPDLTAPEAAAWVAAARVVLNLDEFITRE